MTQGRNQTGGAKPQPACSLTPVLRTPADLSIDWLSVTFPVSHKENVQKDVDALLVKLDLFVQTTEPRAGGGNGYTRSLKLNGSALLLWNPEKPEFGIHLSIPGGCIALFLGPQDHVSDFLHLLVHEYGGECTRCDIAFDDFSGCLDMGQIERYVRKGHFTCRWHTAEFRDRLRTQTGDCTGKILIFGKRQSATYCRIYDKRLERLDKGHECDEEHWIRVELEIKGRKARLVAELIMKRDAKVLSAMLYGYLDFKKQGTDTNRRRWKTAVWWLAFTGHVDKCCITVPKPDRTVETVAHWVEHQVEPSLAMLALAMGEDDMVKGMLSLWAMVKDGRDRLTKQHKDMLLRYHAAQKRKENLTPTEK